MTIINTLFSQLIALVKLPFAKPHRRITQQVNLNIQETNTQSAKKPFCYFNNTKNNSAPKAFVMNNEEISPTNVTQLNAHQSYTAKSQTDKSTIPMQVDTIIINLFEHLPMHEQLIHAQPMKAQQKKVDYK